MTPVQAAFLGLVQGLTEFLPVSSSGHLVLASRLAGVGPHGLGFEVALHLATAVAVVWVLREDVLRLVRGAMGAGPGAGAGRRLLVMLAVATVPTAVMGLSLRDVVERAFASPAAAAAGLLVTGGLMWYAHRLPRGTRGEDRLGYGDALLIGLAQGIAVLPGISRSGATITAALARRLERDLAARFSFLLSLPAIGGAALLDGRALLRGEVAGVEPAGLAAGVVSAFVAGVVAIRILLGLVRRGRLLFFAWYAWAVGAIALIFLRG